MNWEHDVVYYQFPGTSIDSDHVVLRTVLSLTLRGGGQGSLPPPPQLKFKGDQEPLPRGSPYNAKKQDLSSGTGEKPALEVPAHHFYSPRPRVRPGIT